MFYGNEPRNTYVPSNRKPKSVIDITGTELRNCARQWKPSSHFTEGLHHGVDSESSKRITKKNGERTGSGESTPNTKKQTGSNGSTKGDELDVSRFEAIQRWLVLIPCLDCLVLKYIPSTHISVLFCGFKVAIELPSFQDATGLGLLARNGIDIVASMAITLWCFADGKNFFLSHGREINEVDVDRTGRWKREEEGVGQGTEQYLYLCARCSTSLHAGGR